MISLPDPPDNLDPGLSEFLMAIKNKLEHPEEIELKSFTTQQLNALTAANHDGQVVRCTNGDAGDECLAYCNGRAWYVIDLGSKVSTS